MLGVLAGATVLFFAGLIDDVYSLPAVVKLGAQFGAAAIALVMGLSVEIVTSNVLAATLGVLWLVGMTNAFNLLDNMDGLAGSLAVIAATFFAIDAVTVHEERLLLVLSLSLALATLGFLPFNFRPGRPAAVFMGDSGSQVLGFTLGGLGLATSWKVAETTVATLVLPLLVLAIPILDTGLVAITRIVEGRPIHKGGKDHSSHRLVRGGLTEHSAVVLLAAIAAGLGATSLAYSVLGDYRITLVGVLVTFVLLVQFAGFLVDLEREDERGGRARRLDAADDRPPPPPAARGARRLRADLARVHLLVPAARQGDGYAVRAARLRRRPAADPDHAVPRLHRPGPLPGHLALRRLARGGVDRRRRDGLGGRRVRARRRRRCTSATFPRPSSSSTRCSAWSSSAPRGSRSARSTARARRWPTATGRRTLIVGAGRSGRSLVRELRETPGEKVVGFVDDDPRLHRRRLLGVSVYGGTRDIERAIAAAQPDTVLVTIPNAPADRLDAIVRACEAADVPCRFVRRETDLDPLVVLGAVHE